MDDATIYIPTNPDTRDDNEQVPPYSIDARFGKDIEGIAKVLRDDPLSNVIW